MPECKDRKPNMERLEAFGLPETFPPFMVPEKAARFVADTKKGMSKADLLTLAEVSGFSPMWKPLPHMGDGVYGLGLDVDGMQIPFMVRMSSNGEVRGASRLAGEASSAEGATSTGLLGAERPGKD